jgi:transcriptional regulator with XRE-family HTH domain
VTPEDLAVWRKRMRLTQAGAAAALGVGLRMYRYYERGAREDGRTVEIPKAIALAANELAARQDRLAVTTINKDTLEAILTVVGKHLPQPTTLCVVGSAAAMLHGQPERQTPDIDVWGPESDFDIGALRHACEQAGVVYDPRDEIDPGVIYLQVLRPGVTMFPVRFAVERIGRFANLHLVMPPPELIVATKLARALDSDIEDAAWWVRARNLDVSVVESAIERIPQPHNREAARENLVLLRLVGPEPKQGPKT